MARLGHRARWSIRGWRWGLALALLFGMYGGWPAFTTPAAAATANVACSTTALVTAITVAASGDTLSLAAGCTYTLTAVDNTTNGATGLPSIATALTIQGNGAIIERDAAAPRFRLLAVASGGNLTLDSVTLRGGYSSDGSNQDMPSDPSVTLGNPGGAIYNAGTLTLTNSTVHSNTTGAGGMTTNGGGNGGDGGGIWNETTGTLTITGSTIRDNTTGPGAPNLFTTTSGGVGGGIGNLGTLIVNTSAITGNTTGASASSALSGVTGTPGGGIWNNGTATITDSSVEGNSAGAGNKGSFGTGNGGSGGGIWNGGGHTLTISGSTISRNTAGTGSAGDIVSSGGTGGTGGGVWNAGTLNLFGSTVSSNTGGTGGEAPIIQGFPITGGAGGAGGGIWSDSGGTITAVGSTIAGNAGGTGGAGATTGTAGAGGLANDGPLSLTNTIIAGNRQGTDPNGANADCAQTGTVGTDSHNLVGTGTGCPSGGTGDRTVAPASVYTVALRALTDNGGPTQTHNLLLGSPALDNGDTAACLAAPISDREQRGYDRTIGSGCDIGAVEYQFLTTTVLGGNPTTAVFGTPVTFTATIIPTSGTATGTVTFAIDNAPQAPVALDGAGIATFTTSTLGVGQHTITAAFVGSDYFAASSGTPVTVTITPPSGGPAVVGVAPASLTFGERQVGTTAESQQVILANTGAGPVAIGDVTIGGAHPGDFAVTFNTCTGSVPAGATCVVGVRFVPTATGARNATLQITDSAAGSPRTVTLSGTGTTSPTNPAPLAIVTVAARDAGSVTPAGTTGYTPGTVATYAATPAAGQVFLGWTLDGQPVGYASPLTFTVNADRTLIATFGPRPSFKDVPSGDPDYQGITTLAALGIVNPQGVNGSNQFQPDRAVARAEIAALVARVFGWDTEFHANPFPDRCDPQGNCIDDELWNNVAALADYGVVGGYTDSATCASAGTTAPCYLPRDQISRVQVVSVVARAFTKTPDLRPTGFWDRLPADGALYANVPDSGTQRSDLATYRQNAGPIPGQANDGTFPDPTGTASRRFIIQVLWQAYSSVYSGDNVP